MANNPTKNRNSKRGGQGRFRPYKPRPYDTPEAALTDLIDQGGGVERVRSILNLSKTQLVAKSDPDSPQDRAFWDEVCRVVEVTGAVAPAHHLAALAGGLFIDLNGAPPADGFALGAASAQEWGEFLAKLFAGLEGDGALDPTEARAALKELDDVLRLAGPARVWLHELANEGDG